MRSFSVVGTFVALLAANVVSAQSLETKPADAFFARYEPVKAPAVTGLYLHEGDRLAIIGDSITEQKMYSRILETYLTVCTPELKVTTRQFGWSGETAEGFLHRMTNDCLRFNPTVATLCYGMNDHQYRAYNEASGMWYSNNYYSVVSSLKAAGARVALGSPGCVGKVPNWAPDTKVPTEDLNLNLCRLRNIDIAIAADQDVRFADVFWPMLTSGFTAQQKYGTNFCIAGKDGVHPGWAGHVVMASAFLSALGVTGDIGTYTVDWAADKATVSAGHTLDRFADHTLTITSTRYPFCATGELNGDYSIRAGMELVSFNEKFNRLVLIVKNAPAARYRVTWGENTRSYSAAELAAGVNLAADYAVNPFSQAFAGVDEAVGAKQKYETRQIKDLFHGPEGKADADGTAAVTEKARQPLAEAVAKAFVPVTHTLRIEAE
jgi:lysophospholipase L1-like esterase